MAKLFANSEDPDQTPHDMGLHCLPITLLDVSRLKWVNCGIHSVIVFPKSHYASQSYKPVTNYFHGHFVHSSNVTMAIKAVSDVLNVIHGLVVEYFFFKLFHKRYMHHTVISGKVLS